MVNIKVQVILAGILVLVQFVYFQGFAKRTRTGEGEKEFGKKKK